jgi:phosphoglycolate phosphatase-like HAD superfamily hydrolase
MILPLKNKKPQVKAVLLDLDGTIFDIAERDAFARYQALNDLGYHVTLDEVRKHYRLGKGTMDLVKELGIKLGEKKERQYIEASFAHFAKRENALNLTKIHAGAYDALSALSKEYELVLVTSRNTLSSTMVELEWFGIRAFFKLIVTGEVAAKHYSMKDLPLLPFQEQRTKLYRCAIDLTRIDPEEMVCVGDAVGEIEPARKLGIKAIGVLTGFSSKEDMEKASISTAKDLTEVVKILS